jgi:spore germination protein
MFKWIKKKKKENQKSYNTNFLNDSNTPISKNLQTNLNFINQQIGHSPDVVIHSFKMGRSKLKVAIVYIDGLADETVINDQILKPVMLEFPKIEEVYSGTILGEQVKENIITIAKAQITQILEESILHVLSGGTVFFIEGNNEALLLDTPGWETRAPEEPSSEPTVRGPRDGFVETLRENIAHLRRRIRDPNFTMITYKIGRRSKADLAIIYIKGLTNQELLEEVKSRIERIDIDMVLGTGYIEQLIEDNFLSPFSQTIVTERPDKVAGALMEGYIAILLDNTPFALVVPATLPMFIQAPEDYYERWLYSSIIRLLRFLIAVIALFLPALYVALVSFHQGLLPTDLTISIAANREGVPFPSLVEALIMEITLEILREAGIRLPKPIGQAVGIVGGLVIGDAAVKAGIVSPIMVIVVALTAISSFALPEYALGISLRILRFVMMLLAGAFGLYGIILGYIMISAHLVKLKSFGIDYTSPFVPYQPRDWKDLLIRGPMMTMQQRPKMMKTQDVQRKSPKEIQR